MVNRERFMLDVDSEGFPQRYDDVPYPPATLAALNVGKTADHAVVQALLADHKCLQCEPVDQIIPATDYTSAEQRILAHMRQPQFAADLAAMVHEANIFGVKRLSDTSAPDAYFGWKS